MTLINSEASRKGLKANAKCNYACLYMGITSLSLAQIRRCMLIDLDEHIDFEIGTRRCATFNKLYL
jgi:hypothetical protein